VGAAARALVASAAAGAVLLAIVPAAAQPCWLTERRIPFAVCFDLGNRLRLDAASDGLGGAVELRHAFPGDDPDVTWRLEHDIAATRATRDAIRATAYSGRYVRHSEDGHLVLPFGRPRKLFLPFDLGAEAQVGTIEAAADSDAIDLGAVRTAALVELSRASHFRRRLAVGAVARWDVELGRDSREARAHEVTPFTLAMIDVRAEAENGLTVAGLRAEAGGAWSTADGWGWRARADAEVERVVIAVQDRPLSIFLGGRYEPVDAELSAFIGVRVAPVVRIPRQSGD
jgi:hypothetical protein